MRKKLPIAAAVAGILIFPFADAAIAAEARRPLTLRDAIETARIMPLGITALGGPAYELGAPAALAPNGKHYAVMTVRGDAKRNGVWLDLLVGDVNGRAATAPKQVAHLFTDGLAPSAGRLAEPLLPGSNWPVWLDDSHVSFLWDDERGTMQIVSVGIADGKVSYLTNQPEDVTTFRTDGRGSLLFWAHAPGPAKGKASSSDQGFTVDAPDYPSFASGRDTGLLATEFNAMKFAITPAHPQARWIKAPGDGIDHIGGVSQQVQPIAFSPDGRHALVAGTPAALPSSWGKVTETYAAAIIADILKGRPSFSSAIPQLKVLDLETATERPLWDAPSVYDRTMIVAWSPSGDSVLLGPTFLPPESEDKDGLAGTAIAVVDTKSGRYRKLPISGDVVSKGIDSLRFLSEDAVEVRPSGGAALRFELRNGAWQRSASSPAAEPAEAVNFELRQDLNDPPAVYAVDRGGRSTLVFDPNPQLRSGLALGRVEAVSWQDAEGRTWHGHLHYPVGYRKGVRYPLVIQTHGIGPDHEFNLYGNSFVLGPGAWLRGPVLAGRGIVVLQVEDKDIAAAETPAEPRIYMNGYEAGARKLASMGLVDLANVGLMGFSRTGWDVEYALTHSDFVYKAAIALDNFDGNYMPAALNGWNAFFTNSTGPAPFGADLAPWLENAPSFSAERVRTPLQMQALSGGDENVLFYWEFFSRLRYLKEPVELYIAPHPERGSHTDQNPAQLLAIDGRVVDWWDFWLNDREDPDPAKADQYARWRHLRQQRDEILKKPRPPLLKWNATPVPEAVPAVR